MISSIIMWIDQRKHLLETQNVQTLSTKSDGSLLKVAQQIFVISFQNSAEQMNHLVQQFTQEIDKKESYQGEDFFYFSIFVQSKIKDPIFVKLIEWEWMMYLLEYFDLGNSRGALSEDFPDQSILLLNPSFQDFKMIPGFNEKHVAGLWGYFSLRENKKVNENVNASASEYENESVNVSKSNSNSENESERAPVQSIKLSPQLAILIDEFQEESFISFREVVVLSKSRSLGYSSNDLKELVKIGLFFVKN